MPADSVPDVARATGWSVRIAALVVLGFAKADCTPTPAQLIAIARLGLEYAIPGKASVDAAVGDAEQVGATINRTELGLMLAIAGNRPALLAAIQRGALSVADLSATSGAP